MKIDRQKLANVIRSLQGVDDEVKSQLLGLLNKKESFGLKWDEKSEDAEEQMCDQLPVLQEVSSRRILSDDPTAPNHVLIEGDNLHALTSLCYTHEGEIDVIYIDPPYNTGNKDFIYNDSYVDAEDGYRHSKWLSFMKRRLTIAKRLLSDKGVIFISIDNNEVAQLKMLCDEVFGERNFIAILPRVTKKSGKAHSDSIAGNHDFVITYTKERENASFMGIKNEDKGFDNTDEYLEERGRYKLNQTLDYNSLWYNPAMDFPLYIEEEAYYPGGSKDKHIARHNGIHDAKDWVWRWSQAKFDFGYKNGFIVLKKSKNGTRIYTKTYLKASIEKNGDRYYIEYLDRDTKMSSLEFVENAYSNDNAKKEISQIIGGNAFDFPKPTSLVSQLMSICSKKDSTILDFFAGSGTTLHATMQLNAEDGGHRKCILVTNNENGICENVTYVRNKRVIEGYTTPKGEHVEGLKANNLRYYKTEFVDRERTSRNMRALMKMATDMLCIKEDLYDEVEGFGQLPQKDGIYRHFRKEGKQMLVIYKEDYIEDFIAEIEKMEVTQRIHVYVFSPSNDPFTEVFDEVADKVKLVALPAAIYEAYKEVLPQKKETLLPEFESQEQTKDEEEKEVTLDNLFD